MLSATRSLCVILLVHDKPKAVLGHAAEEANLVHILDCLGLIFLTTICAICPQESLALWDQWYGLNCRSTCFTDHTVEYFYTFI